MKYVQILWEHQQEYDPSEIYSEIGDDNYEQRKIEIFKNGKVAYATKDKEEDTFLCYEEYPELNILNNTTSTDKTTATYISREEFEKLWSRYVENQSSLKHKDHE